MGRRFGRALRRLLTWRGTLAAGDERYRREWNVAARVDALTAILTAPDGTPETELRFDERGRADAAWLRRFVAPTAVVLDVGCGIGRVERHLAGHVARLHAVDVSDEMITAARRWTAGCANLEFHRTSATDLSPITPATVDLAFSFLVLQHTDYEDAFRALREIARVLKADGRAVLQCPSFASPLYRGEFVRRADALERAATRVRPYTHDLVACLLDLATLALERFEPPPPGGSLSEHDMIVMARRRPDPPEVRDFAIRPLTPEAAGTRSVWAISATVTDANRDVAGGRVVVRFAPAGPTVAATLDASTFAGTALTVQLTLDDAPPGRLDATFAVEDVVGVGSVPMPFYLTLTGPAGRPADRWFTGRLSPPGGPPEAVPPPCGSDRPSHGHAGR